MCEAYIAAGRPDLADCARDQFPYVRLKRFFGLHASGSIEAKPEDLLYDLNDFTWRLGQGGKDDLPATLRDWGIRALKRYESDAHLADVITLDGELQQTRQSDIPRQLPPEQEHWLRTKQWHHGDFVGKTPC